MTKKRLLISLALIVAMFVVGLIGYMTIIFAGNYVIDDKKLVMNSASTLVDEEGELITRLYLENRDLVSIQDIPGSVKDAFVAIEDTRFYDHQGIDVRAIGRALYRDILAGAKVEGGSTITQQLAKNTFLSHDKSWLRKTKEVLIAMNLERKYSKDEILEMYLNRIYFGHGAYGIQAASKLYFNKDVSELTVHEGALLAGLPKGPNSYSPITNPERSKQRRNLVLNVMEREGYLTPEEAIRSQGKTLAIDRNESSENEAYLTYIDMVLDEIEEKYHLTNEEVLTGGYTIVVPMDKQVQQASFELFQNDAYFPGQDEHVQGSYVLMDSETGGVLAVQGGRDYVRKGMNRVNTKRQPGSTLKPLAVFAPALETGEYEPYSLLKDELQDYGGYTPRNASNEYQGEVTMFDAITHSANAPAVWLLNELGVPAAKRVFDTFGLNIPDEGLAIALGGLKEGVTPLEMTTMYRSFANEGRVISPHFVKAVYDRNQELIGTADQKEEQVFSKQTAWYMTRMLESVVDEGTAAVGTTTHALAGKTGTTSYTGVAGATRDAWFVGYTPDVVGSLWMGYDATTHEQHLTGGSAYATTLFKDILNEVEREHVTAFTKPEGVNDLEPPIRFVAIDDLEASLTLRGKGLIGVKLNWTPSADERLQYHIYEVNDDGLTKVATAQNGEVIVGDINLFSLQDYAVAPYNPLIDREGPVSNVASVKIGFSF
ncbi:transglycosylase domain-containing protein [Desertibacillus haloalkaliphilus]|uniref:transglycosylase domain-containing protein n=1 Tax=Desertibacillus haloalkaliphilus TaxID=1328930 RepID=UPI001C2739CB|nr:PBP1A family penicillin-binding protein [Desertibacillus haloalkaliphilus]MBU8905466.1 PBP1A family penicillin-binding protein [Desertibacillus haloalkaliphilus]